jgi:hypothetical protein
MTVPEDANAQPAEAQKPDTDEMPAHADPVMINQQEPALSALPLSDPPVPALPKVVDDELSQWVEQSTARQQLKLERSSRVKEVRRRPLHHLIISSENLRELVEIIEEQRNTLDPAKTTAPKYAIDTMDGASYESSSAAIFAPSQIVDTHQIQHVHIDWFSSDDMTIAGWIRIDIRQGDYSGSDIRIESYDRTWVNGVMGRFENMIAHWERQSRWPRWFAWPIALILAYGFGRLALSLLVFVITGSWSLPTPRQQIDQRSLSFITFLGAMLFGIFPAAFFLYQFYDLWPSIEFRTGREHEQKYRRRRVWLWGFVVVFIVPILSTLAYDLIRWLIGL